jgi:oxygen-dependent protoporphyrinogen oxidase
LEQIVDLGLVDDVVFTSKDSLAAKNRFIYYPDRLNRMPSGGILADFWNTLSLVQSGVLDGAQNIVAEPWQPRRPSSMTDESIGDFVSRRIDKRIAQNMLSALMHGIYAGDIWRLSARSLLPLLWHLEGQYNSVLGGILQLNMNDQRGSMVVPSHPHDFADAKAMQEEFKGDWAQKFMDGLSDCSTFSFKNGLQQLSQTLQDSLEKNKQVDIKMGTTVQSFTMSKDSPEQVQVIAGVRLLLLLLHIPILT